MSLLMSTNAHHDPIHHHRCRNTCATLTMSTIGQDTRFNPARAGELEDDATSAPSNGLVRQYAHRGPMSDEDVRACLSNIMYIHDKDLVMTMTIGDIVSEIPWGAQAAALLGEFGRNSTIKIGKYIR